MFLCSISYSRSLARSLVSPFRFYRSPDSVWLSGSKRFVLSFIFSVSAATNLQACHASPLCTGKLIERWEILLLPQDENASCSYVKSSRTFGLISDKEVKLREAKCRQWWSRHTQFHVAQSVFPWFESGVQTCSAGK